MIRAALLCLALPVSAQAAGFSPPEGCTTTMTVQSKQCRVSNYYTCQNDPAGTQWRVDADQEGPFFLTQTNIEGEWLQSHDGAPSGAQHLAEVQDHGSIRTLFEAGQDSYDFWLEREDGSRSHVTGRDKLTGETSVIDGQSLARTRFSFTETDADGVVLQQARGQEYVSRERGSFFAGPTEHGDGTGTWRPSDGSPMTFAFPGDKGFEAGQPIFDCDAVSS
ncbi:hypothetical protein [Falsirhodobacter sp. 1013]|uniref:hypothetical protein n=1 Tax=Falsirhodobacter sp. 1013 TaxID=3417566 RepID=UPI003EC0D8B0